MPLGQDQLIQNAYHELYDQLIEYNWQYRRKICTKPRYGKGRKLHNDKYSKYY